MMSFLKAGLIVASLVSSSVAVAFNATVCTDGNHEVRVEQREEGVRTTLTVNGESIPRVLEYCQYEYRSFRCPHRTSAADYEVSPRINGGDLRSVIVIVNTDRDSKFYELKDCH